VDIVKPKKAMLLAAGRGERLRPLTDEVPKCMVPVWGKPILEHNIEHLARFGVTELMINLCYRPQVVIDYFGNGHKWGVQITYSIEDKALGTAGGVKRVEGFFKSSFYVWYGDNLSYCNLDQLFYLHSQRDSRATIALFYRENPTASGIVGLNDDGKITKFKEKPKPEEIFSKWINAGIYALEPEVLNQIPSNQPHDFGKEVFPGLLNIGAPLFGYKMEANEGLWWIDTPEDLERVNKVERLP
jgi:NDP-sugar pyrophosphorylase family protein